jgi:predicted TPR repeat methyltransferase
MDIRNITVDCPVTGTLHSAERFAHSIEYIRDQAARAGLSEISTMQIALRRPRF